MAKEKIEIMMDIDPIERLTKEIEVTTKNGAKKVGEFLLKEFEKDDVLKQCYFDRKVTLMNIWKYIEEEAVKMAKEEDSIAIEDDTVYGWAIHFIQDGEIEEPAAEKMVMTRTVITEEDKAKAKADALEEFKKKELERLEKERKAKEEKEKAKLKELARKEKEKRESSGQLSLFDLGCDSNE